jgi:DNA-binding PadR family transcriptional regulator
LRLSKALSAPVQWKVIILLSRQSKLLAFTEIYNYVKEDCSSGTLCNYLKVLEKTGFVKKIRKLDLTTGKARTSFYEISPEGKEIAEELIKILSKIN